MANPFLNKTDLVDRDVETALLLEQAIVTDIGKAVAYTDGEKVFVNTDDNLFDILPAYDQRMLKWILWHEKMHLELRHHNRFFKYLHELEDKDAMDEFHISKEEINIIMDILVHDSLARMFPELVETAVNNCAQMRNRNSLGYTFKTHTLEEMLDEYSKTKEDDKDGEGEGEDSKEDKDGEEGKDSKGEKPSKKKDSKTDSKGETPSEKKSHGEGKGKGEKEKDRPEDGEPEENDESERPEPGTEPLPDEHDKTDWSKLEDREDKEFITKEESERITEAVNRLKKKKFKLAKLTETLNGLVTSTRKRSYAMPSTIYAGRGILLKGSTPGRTKLYLIFDASGSMTYEMDTFKNIIGKSIPQAMETPCEWFAGACYTKGVKPYKVEHGDGYFKSTFKDFMEVYAASGYSDDGDRTIELCWLAEQKGYSPIGITDGGGQISWSKDKLKQLKRTVLVGQNPKWLERVKEINPMIQTLDI